MFTPTLYLGNWQAILYPISVNSDKLIQKFWNIFPEFFRTSQTTSRPQNIVIIGDPNSFEEKSFLNYDNIIKDHKDIWEKYTKWLQIAYSHYSSLNQPNPNLSIESNRRFLITEVFQTTCQDEIEISAICLDQSDSITILLLYCLYLSMGWNHKNGGICIHSSAIVRKTDGFLFLGPSEAGKSTVARFSAEMGYDALGDDLNFVLDEDKNGFILASAPSPVRSSLGYSEEKPKLRGIFKIQKDDHDELIPLSPKMIARTLFDSFYFETPFVNRLPIVSIKYAYNICCKIARNIPGYEMHFRKTPDFLKLIDSELALE